MARDITTLLQRLSDELARRNARGDVFLDGGAVMCLAHHARPSTADADGYFVAAAVVRDAARMVGQNAGIDHDWLNAGVKEVLSDTGDFAPFLDLPALRVLIAQPEYLLAMKCLALRLGLEFHDLDDVRFLLRVLDVRDVATARDIITRYYPAERFPAKTLFVLEELLSS